MVGWQRGNAPDCYQGERNKSLSIDPQGLYTHIVGCEKAQDLIKLEAWNGIESTPARNLRLPRKEHESPILSPTAIKMVIKMYEECIDCGERPEGCKCENPVFRKVFEHAPSGIPPLNDEQFKFLEKELNKPPTKEQIENLRRSRKVWRIMQNGFPMEYNGELLTTQDGKKWIYDGKHHEWVDVSVDNEKLEKLVREAKRIR